jgi:photosystem II stability/assembly factor-like uncharacterized protein
MKRTIIAVLLMLVLSLTVSAQEKRITNSSVSVEMTSDDVDTLKTIKATVHGGWSGDVIVKTATRRTGLQSGDGWISLSPPLISETLNDVHTFNDNTALIIGNYGAIYKTRDRGTNWTKISSGTTRDLNAVFFLDGYNGWIVGKSGTILKTENGGESWRIISTNLNTVYDVYFTTVNIGYLATHNRIYKTTDGGDSWIEKFSTTDESLCFESIAFCDSQTGVAVGNSKGTYRTIDAGESWQKIEIGGTTND